MSCSSKRQRTWTKTPNVTCAYCSVPFYKNKTKQAASKSGLFFCCIDHRNQAMKIGGPNTIEAIQPPQYRGSKQPIIHYREFAFRNHGQKCNRCQFDSCPEILVVHHKDEDRSNNSLENLEVLCPNCHAIEHYGGQKRVP